MRENILKVMQSQGMEFPNNEMQEVMISYIENQLTNMLPEVIDQILNK